MGLISYVLQDRLKEDLGRCIEANIFDKYQEDPLVTASFDKVQIEVSEVTAMISPHGPLLSSDVAVWRVTRTGPPVAGPRPWRVSRFLTPAARLLQPGVG